MINALNTGSVITGNISHYEDKDFGFALVNQCCLYLYFFDFDLHVE